MLHRYNKTAGAKRGLVETSAYDALLPYVAAGQSRPRYALHFGTVEKVGVNPRSEYDTPLAVCAYPLTSRIFDEFLKIKLPFAQKKAKHLYLLEIQPEARVFYSTEWLFNSGVGPRYIKYSVDSRSFFYSTRPEDYENSPKYVSEEHSTVARAAQWGHKLWKMGIDVWVDANGEGILHRNEPSQVMFFNPNSYRVVFSMSNPKDVLEAQYGRDWRKRGDLNLRSVNLESANLPFIDLSDKDLRRAKLAGANLTRANLAGAILTEAYLSYTKLIRANLTRANLIRARLTGANLTGADLTGADLTGTRLEGVRYDDTTIWPDSVRDVLRVWRGDKDLQGTDLRGADLGFAKLQHADLTGAALNGAILDGAYLDGAILDGITYDYTTIWPEGFTPPPSTPRPNRRR